MTDLQVLARDASLAQRDRLGEAAFWSEPDQALFWVDIAGKRIHRLSPASGRIRVWEAPRHVSAAVPDARGGLVAAMTDGLHRLDLTTGVYSPFSAPDGDPANRSNECRVDADGRLWLGTMANNLAADGSPLPITRSSGGLFCVDAAGASTHHLADIGIANTLCWSPDGARLYFADSLAGVMWSFAYDAHGGEGGAPRLSDRRVFLEETAAPGVPDGSAMDEDGCLWNARWGASQVIRVTPQGRVDRVIDLPVAQPTCVAFGDADRRTLYITSARQALEGLAPDSLDGALLALRVDVAGPASPLFAG